MSSEKVGSHEQEHALPPSGREPDASDTPAPNRHQRMLLFGAGIAITIVLLLLAGVLQYMMVNDYIASRYSDFIYQKTRLQLIFAERESGLRAAVLHEESVWGGRPSAPEDLVDLFVRQHGHVVVHPNRQFDPVLVMGDVAGPWQTTEWARYLALAKEFNYRTGGYTRVQFGRVFGYMYSPDRRFIAIGPVPADDPLKRNGVENVKELLGRIAPDIGDLTNPAVADKLLESRNALWFPPVVDPFSGQSVFRVLLPVFSDGKPILVMVRYLLVQPLIEDLFSHRYDEVTLLVDSRGKVILDIAQGTGLRETVRQALAAQPWNPHTVGMDRRYLQGLFIASAPVQTGEWTLIYAFSWRAILGELWPRLVGYTVLMLAVTGFMWTLLLLLDRAVFRPDYERSKRIFESENLNRTMVAAAPSGFALLSFERGDIMLQNDVMCRYAANVREDEPPLHAQLHSLYDRSPDAPAWQSDLVMSLKLKGGQIDDLQVSLVRTKYQGSEVLLCSFSDVTNLKNTERKLNEARAAADAANQAKSAFLAVMSHEIRTPLNAILGNLELLGRSQLSSSQSERLRVVSSAAVSLLTIINDILDFSKVESGQMTVETVRFDLADTIREVGEIFAPIAREKGLEFNCVIDDTLASHYLGDPTKIRQIAVNLVSNAIKFTSSGEVILEVYRKDDTVDDSPITIGVIDTGIGMSAAQQETVFHAFEQADSSITRRYGGTGLGLALCRRLTDLMGGTLLVRSELNAGSTFVVTLPLRADTSVPVEHTEHDAGGPSAGLLNTHAFRVLVVDDQLSNRELIAAQLATLGYEADMADNGGEALRRFKERDYDVVMTDLSMPGMDGYALARCLRAQKETVPIIAITAHATGEERLRCESMGIDMILLKPVLLGTMDQALRRLISEADERPAVSVAAMQDVTRGPLPERVHAAMNRSLDESLVTLHKALEADDMKTVREQLHATRGSFAMIHEEDIANDCRQMEQYAKDHDTAGLRDALARFEPLARAALARRATDAQIGI
ncbi:Multi-sensor hybrid histidine kinase [Paraburkholderia ribeironis]|uniref:Sensory/regulatory protein RpfC n=1 Tax=Paraburkholderia ribeironis TaxID=1247936 RepID=A0A1N7RT22_9BURK|nr:ATP-binding protein [Paraburkholderia ribeironis]SIT38281.1 Multi-sensor hybrid histidine kinase [Paraburkholderia ribeironis]